MLTDRTHKLRFGHEVMLEQQTKRGSNHAQALAHPREEGLSPSFLHKVGFARDTSLPHLSRLSLTPA